MSTPTNITITPNASANKVTILLEGEITLANISGIKRDLLDVIQKYGNIEIQCANVKGLDLSCVQLFTALRKSAVKQKKELTLQVELPESIQELLLNAGININEL